MKKLTYFKFVTAIICVFATFFPLFSASAEGTGEYLYKLKEIPEYPVTFISKARLQSGDTLADKLGIYKTDDLELLKEYEEMGILEFYEENSYAYLFDMPNTDEFMSTLVTGGVPLGESYNQIGVNELWSLGLTGRGIRVAVIDSGVSANEHLKVNLAEGYNYANDNTDVTDLHGHGTLVAGLIAGNSNSYKGVAYEAEIVPLRVFVGNTAPLDIIAESFYDAAFKYDCDVINMSFGTKNDTDNIYGSPTLRTVIDAIYADEEKQDVVFVAASGNKKDGEVGKAEEYMYPASYDEVISVGNIDRYDNLYSTSYENDMVDVVAPGTSLTLLSHKEGVEYTVNGGTSFSCPIVSGVVALIKQIYPDLSHSIIERVLQYTATDLGNAGFDTSYGYGKVNCGYIAQLLFYEALYVSPVVEHKGTYNIAIHNGIYDLFETSAFISGYNDGKMMFSSKYEISLEWGENFCMTFSDMSPETKLFLLDKAGLMPITSAIDLNSRR